MEQQRFTIKCNKCGNEDIRIYPRPVAQYSEDLEVLFECEKCSNEAIYDDDFWNKQNRIKD